MLSEDRKLEIIRSVIYGDYKNYQKSCCKARVLSKYNNGVSDNFQILNELYEDNEDWKDCEKFYWSHQKRIYRLKKSLKELMKEDCVFVTLTFTDYYLNNFSEDELYVIVHKWLWSHNCSLKANKDYGKKNERLHYHGVLQVKKIDPLSWKYGNCDVKKVRKGSESAISKYLVKLVYHALKETTRESRVISRNVKKNLCVHARKEMMPLKKNIDVFDNCLIS